MTAALACALVLVASVLVVASAASAYPSSCRQTFTQLTGVSAPPLATTVSELPVAVAGTVADLDVRIGTDTLPGADVYLTAEGQSLDQGSHLLSSTGGTFDVTLDDEASEAITGASASGRFHPLTPLSALDGQRTDQTWQLTVVNNGESTVHAQWQITVTYRACVPDRDSDGVPDARDSCPFVAAHTRSGCRLAARKVTAKYSHHKFHGTLSSPVAGCRGHRTVTVWKSRKGPDHKVGAATTHADGTYRLKRPKRPGRYYASAPRAVVVHVAECPAVKSSSLRLR